MTAFLNLPFLQLAIYSTAITNHMSLTPNSKAATPNLILQNTEHADVDRPQGFLNAP